MSEHEHPQQLTLLPPSDVPVRFRLDDATRRRGLHHVAEIRRQLEARRAARLAVGERPTRTPIRSDAA